MHETQMDLYFFVNCRFCAFFQIHFNFNIFSFEDLKFPQQQKEKAFSSMTALPKQKLQDKSYGEKVYLLRIKIIERTVYPR